MLNKALNETWYGKQALAIIKPTSDDFIIYEAETADRFGTLKVKGGRFKQVSKIEDKHVLVKNTSITIYITQPRIEIADTVFHKPSGEVWTVGRADNLILIPCGYPLSVAKINDCILIEKATKEEADKLKLELAELPVNAPRRI